MRELYHAGEAEPKGRRTPDQQTTAGLLSYEADELFDGIKNFAVILTGGAKSGTKPVPDDESIKWGNLTYKDYRLAFGQMYVGLGMMTDRVADKNGEFKNKYGKLMDLSDTDRISVMGALFGDFQPLNAYRFGVEGMGVDNVKTKRVYPEDGGAPFSVKVTEGDKDQYGPKGQTDAANRRKYTPDIFDRTVLHGAVKIAPEDVVALRLEFPEVDADEFFHIVWSFRNPRERLENIQ